MFQDRDCPRHNFCHNFDPIFLTSIPVYSVLWFGETDKGDAEICIIFGVNIIIEAGSGHDVNLIDTAGLFLVHQLQTWLLVQKKETCYI